MSGICGIISLDGAPVEPTALRPMAQAAAYRGPDGIHYWHGQSAGLAHLALNLTPESVSERQPLVSREGDLVIAADARVDNRPELIQFLTSKNYLAADAPTDAGLILAAYRCWGTEMPAQIIGDFAFAIWDTGQRQLFAARDPTGMRSFYYRPEPDRLLFATEISQILEAPSVPAQLFEPAVGAHLAGYFERLEWTFYEGIRQLPPGHALLVSQEKRQNWRYWEIDVRHRIRYRDEQEYVDHFLELFQEAIRCRFRSIKPVGLLLSGGLDSGSIAATAGWMRRCGLLEHDPGFLTFSWAFDQLSQCDERLISDAIAQHYDLPARHVAAEEAYPLSGYPHRRPHRDEPSPAVYEELWESAMAAAQRQGVGVILTGGRGDLATGVDVFDYLSYLATGRWIRLWRELREHSRWLGIPALKLARTHMVNPLKRGLWPPHRATGLRRALQRLLRRPKTRQPFPEWIDGAFAERIELHKMLTGCLPTAVRVGCPNRQRRRFLFGPMAIRVDTSFERVSARFGLEAADPWSDRRIVSFFAAVPQHLLNRPRQRKRLVRHAMEEIVPQDVLHSMGKVSMGPLLESALKDWGHETVLRLIENSEAASLGFVDAAKLRAYYESYCRGEKKQFLFWPALTLETWLRHHWSSNNGFANSDAFSGIEEENPRRIASK